MSRLYSAPACDDKERMTVHSASRRNLAQRCGKQMRLEPEANPQLEVIWVPHTSVSCRHCKAVYHACLYRMRIAVQTRLDIACHEVVLAICVARIRSKRSLAVHVSIDRLSWAY